MYKVKRFGMCPVSGCIQKDKQGNWRVISNRDGSYWKAKFKSRKNAESALRGYHASK